MKVNYNDLLTNATEFIEYSVEDYHNERYKSSVINLWAGILLLMKCKLFKIHPVLLVSDMLKYMEVEFEYSITHSTYAKLRESSSFTELEFKKIQEKLGEKYTSIDKMYAELGITNENKRKSLLKYARKTRTYFNFDIPDLNKDFKTVNYKEIIARLKIMGEYTSTIEKHNNDLRILREKRNRVEHYVNDSTAKNLISIFNKAIPFINDFIEYDLQESAELLFKNMDNLIKISTFVDPRKRTVSDFVSLHSNSAKDIANGSEATPTSICTNCGSETIDSEDNGILYCKNCGCSEGYNTCSWCHGIFPEYGFEGFYEYINMCENCFEYYANR